MIVYSATKAQFNQDVVMNQTVIAIYNILGQKQTTTDIEVLTTGTYIVVTSSGSYKMVR